MPSPPTLVEKKPRDPANPRGDTLTKRPEKRAMLGSLFKEW